MPARNCLFDAGGDTDYATAANWDTDTAPVNTDSVAFPKMSSSATPDIVGSDESATLLVNFDVEPDCGLNFGSRLLPLHIDTDYMVYHGSGQGHFEIDNSTSIIINHVGPAGDEFEWGLNLIGTPNTLLIVDVESGDLVGVAALANDTGEFTTIDIRGGEVTIGEGVTMTNLLVSGGVVHNHSAAAAATVTGGLLYQEAGELTTLNGDGGRCVYNAAAGYVTAHVRSGFTLDLTDNPNARTVGTGGATNLYAGGKILRPVGGIITFATDISWSGGGRISAA